jgi:protein-tyrosine phosphatase
MFEAHDADGLTDAKRVIELAGGRNFRDLGGYSAGGNRRVRRGLLYRSGTLSNLTLEDHARLRDMGIRMLCDFRTRHEREREPVSWDGDGRVALGWDYDPRLVSVSALLAGAQRATPVETPAGAALRPSAQLARGAMMELYRRLPVHLAEPYAALFERLSAGDLPLVFGCAAGKDRTGVAAALVLSCLGVPWETIVADFTLTNELVDLEQVLFQDPRGGIGLDDEYRQLARVGREIRAPFLDASPEYLAAAFEQIRRDHGSIDEYLRVRLGVDEARSARIRAHLLEG